MSKTLAKMNTIVNAMDSYASQVLSDYREKLKGEIKTFYDDDPFFNSASFLRLIELIDSTT